MVALKSFFKKPESKLSFREAHPVSQLSSETLEQLLLFSEKMLFQKLSLEFSGKPWVLVSPEEKGWFEKIPTAGLRFNPESPAPFEGSLPVVWGSLANPPIVSQSAEAVCFPATRYFKKNEADLFSGILKLPKNGGRFYLTCIHPTLQFMLGNSGKTLSEILHFFRERGFYLEGLEEGLADEHTRPFWVDLDADWESIRDLPLVLFLRLVCFRPSTPKT